MTLEEAMMAVWRDTLVEGKAEVELEGQKFAVRETPRKRLREVDFVFEGQPLRGVAAESEDGIALGAIGAPGTQVMQFLSAGRYVGNVVDGKIESRK
jgi:hypothetical protein